VRGGASGERRRTLDTGVSRARLAWLPHHTIGWCSCRSGSGLRCRPAAVRPSPALRAASPRGRGGRRPRPVKALGWSGLLPMAASRGRAMWTFPRPLGAGPIRILRWCAGSAWGLFGGKPVAHLGTWLATPACTGRGRETVCWGAGSGGGEIGDTVTLVGRSHDRSYAGAAGHRRCL
jgi:hypothetical protein